MDEVVLFGNFCVCFTEVFFSWKLVSCTTWLEWNQWFSVKITISKDVFSDTFFLFVSCTSKLEKKHTENLSLGTKKMYIKKIYARLRSIDIILCGLCWRSLYILFVCLFLFYWTAATWNEKTLSTELIQFLNFKFWINFWTFDFLALHSQNISTSNPMEHLTNIV